MASALWPLSHQYQPAAATRHGGLRVAGRDRLTKRGVEVVVVGEPTQPDQLLGAAQVRRGGLGELDEVRCVGAAEVFAFPRLVEPVQAVRPDGLEHPVTGYVVAGDHQQRLVDERGEQVGHVICCDDGVGAHPLRGLRASHRR